MKTKLAILGGLAILGAGIWYLFFTDKAYDLESGQDPVGSIGNSENSHDMDEPPRDHLRHVMHKSKEFASQ
jgi:hypothetical protein